MPTQISGGMVTYEDASEKVKSVKADSVIIIGGIAMIIVGIYFLVKGIMY